MQLRLSSFYGFQTMINVNDKILAQVDESEMWLLLHITKRLGKKMFCWPSNKTLMEDTGWKIDKLRDVKNTLIDKKLISVEIKEGTSNIYRVETDFLGVYVGADRLSDTPSEKPTTPTRKNQLPTPSEKPTHKYYQSEVLKSNPLGASAMNDIDKRKENFQKSISPFVPEYGSKMCNDFYQYWTEATSNGKKMKFELQKTWETKRRLLRWKKNNDNKRPKSIFEQAQSVTHRQVGTNNESVLKEVEERLKEKRQP